MSVRKLTPVFLLVSLVLASPIAGEYDRGRTPVRSTSGAVPLAQSGIAQDSGFGTIGSVESSADNFITPAGILNTPVEQDALSGSSNSILAPGESGSGNLANLVSGGPVFESSSGSDSSIDNGRNQQSAGPLSAGTGNILDFTSSIQSVSGAIQAAGNFGSISEREITVTEVVTRDVFNTISNLFYNSIPVTLTQFEKTTVLAPTLQVVTTPVDDRVFVATAPATRTDTKTVTDTRTAHQYATEVSTDIYTITHRAYDIQQQTVVSTLFQTQVFHPTVVRTRIDTNYDTQTVVQTVTHTVVVEPRTVTTIIGVQGDRPIFGQQQQTGQLGPQQGSRSDQQLAGQSSQQQKGSRFGQQAGQSGQQQQGPQFGQQTAQTGQQQQGSSFGQQVGQSGQQQVPQAVRQGQIIQQIDQQVPEHGYY